MRTKKFKKILIANRGEIALRIMRTCARMGISSVAVYSDTDFRSLHVRKADEAVPLHGITAMESYLSIEKIIAAARQTGAEAIHPGYGFLSENPLFAQKVTEGGIVFIGPPASAVALLGNKLSAKRLARETGVPVIPGHTDPVSNLETALEVACLVGYPVLLKPSAGGGGKGMRIVHGESQMEAALSVCRKEAMKAFADDRVFIERYVPHPRHIEFQILADSLGNCVHLGERECSIQRRYQKVIEEAPSIAVGDSLRREMGALACKLAQAAGYVNAGTVEFLLDPQGQYSFLEMNTRLQVEHTVTEMTTGLDLVELQIRIAQGEKLPFRQEDVVISGWAIEARVCAEDPAKGFFPATGLITRYSQPRGEHIRVDSGMEAGGLVSVYFDSLLAKVIAWGSTREESRRRLVEALNSYHIEGVVTNINFINRILNLSSFCSGDISTDFIEQHFEGEKAREEPPVEHLRLAALASALIYHNRNAQVRESLKPMASSIGGAAKSQGHYDYIIKYGDRVFPMQLQDQEKERTWTARIDDRLYTVSAPPFEFYRRRLKLEIDDTVHRFILEYRGSFIECRYYGVRQVFEIYSPKEWELASLIPSPQMQKTDDRVRSPMPGLILEVKVSAGSRVYRGQDLAVLESMKMETCIPSPCDGIVSEILVQEGQTVETGDVILRF